VKVKAEALRLSAYVSSDDSPAAIVALSRG
jgi:hypothetical protein